MEFNTAGLLPADDYHLTFGQLRESILVKGKGDGSPWDESWRSLLVNNLEIMVNQLWEIGITEIFIDGSFVEDKAHPNDIDGYFVCDFNRYITGELQNELNEKDRYKIWTWDSRSRREHKEHTKKQLPMWHAYRVELYPHFDKPYNTGIRDEFGNDQQFPAAFRKTRDTYLPKGIIKIINN
ncbi:DUF6932 family protein [uncultured Brevibacillus sp.]|uniref:DUF6932 family protein n=1 Tax=uncultured Brevibacillus sp. TaxID=169970 RepID=UPI00259A1F39|nr:hypothetical protein [uncultured Brevibacillus sp.]